MKEQTKKTISCQCPNCGSMQNAVKGENNFCTACGTAITSQDIKNAQAVFVKTNDGKKKFVIGNLVKKWWFWVAAVLLIVIIGSSVGGSEDNTKTVKINEWASISDYEMRVVSVENTKAFGTGVIGSYSTQNNYVCVLIELKNNSNYSHIFSFSDFVIKCGSNEYESKGTEAYWYSESKGANYPALYLNGDIDGGLSGKYYLVFETAESTKDETYYLEYEYAFDKVQIALN